MPDKQHDSRLMAMLERKGIVRRVGSGGEEDAPERNTALPISASAFDSSAAGGAGTSPVPRRPIPGMSDPVVQNAPFSDTLPEQQRLPLQKAGPPAQASSGGINTEQKRWAPMPAESFTDDFDTFSEAVPWGEDSEEQNAAPLAYAGGLPRGETPPEDFTDSYHDIDELYDALSLKSVRKDNIFLIEEYLKTLPESLPEESRRDIVSKIVTASGFDNDMLMGDGVLRVKMLKEYAERFARRTDEYAAARQTELDELERQTLRVRKLIETRRELHKKQFFTIEAEAQRLKDILTFITG